VLFGLQYLMAPVAAAAAPQTFKDWTVTVTDDRSIVVAATLSDSGSVFGEFCRFGDANCYWFLVIDSACDLADKSPSYGALVNTSAGSAYLQMSCDGKTNDGKHRFLVSNWSDLERVIKGAEKVGFALPLAPDQFKVVRFSLKGQKNATKVAEELTREIRQSGRGDEVL